MVCSCVSSPRMGVRLFGWMELVSALLMLTLMGALIGLSATQSKGSGSKDYLTAVLGSGGCTGSGRSYGQYHGGSHHSLYGEVSSNDDEDGEHAHVHGRHIWFKASLVTIDQLVRLCIAIGLIRATNLGLHPNKALSLIELWGRVNVVLILVNVVMWLFLCDIYYMIILCLPFKILYYVAVRSFLVEIKDELRNRDAHNMTQPGGQNNSENRATTTGNEDDKGLNQTDYAIMRNICLC